MLQKSLDPDFWKVGGSSKSQMHIVIISKDIYSSSLAELLRDDRDPTMQDYVQTERFSNTHENSEKDPRHTSLSNNIYPQMNCIVWSIYIAPELTTLCYKSRTEIIKHSHYNFYPQE